MKLLIKFHDLVLEITKVELLFDMKVVTISSMALKNKLGIEPISGYNGGKTNKIQSKIGLKWLNETKNQIRNSHDFRWIYHKVGEQNIGNIYVDGYDKSTDTIYEFLGCFYHGCSDCFDLNKFNKKCSKMYGKLNAETMNRLSYLKKRCRNLVVMKECEYKDRNDDFNYKYPLKIRDVLYGGQTSPAVLYKDCFDVGKKYSTSISIHYILLCNTKNRILSDILRY